MPAEPFRDLPATVGNTAPRLTPLRADHLPDAVGLSSAMGWPYREADWRLAFELGAGFAAEVDGRLVATAMWWPYGDTHATVGMIIVVPEMQGRGLGRALMDELLYAARSRTVFLNSTQAGLPLYTRLGFVPRGQICQHQAVLTKESRLPDNTIGLHVMRASDVEQVRLLDLAATAMDRTALLNALFEVGTIMVVDRGAGVTAYACAREFGRGVVIGPVIAQGSSDASDAMLLIATLACRYHGRFVRIDVTEESGLSGWLTEFGLPCVGREVAMARGIPTPAGSADAAARLFALASQSFG